MGAGERLRLRDHDSDELSHYSCGTADIEYAFPFLPDGEFGELVFTSLTKEAMPVVRYRTRDLTRLLPGTARAAFRRMEKITGRSDDMIILRGVNIFPTQIEEQIFRIKGLSPHYEIHLGREGRMDTMAIRCEALTPGSAGLDRELSHLVKSVLGITARVEVTEPGTLPRSEGKAKRIFDERPRR